MNRAELVFFYPTGTITSDALLAVPPPGPTSIDFFLLSVTETENAIAFATFASIEPAGQVPAPTPVALLIAGLVLLCASRTRLRPTAA